MRIELDTRGFSTVYKQICASLVEKHEQYEAQGRDLEARAMGRAITLVYRRMQGDFDDTEPTGWDSL